MDQGHTTRFFVAIQEKLSSLSRVEHLGVEKVETVGALDVAYKDDVAYAAAVAWSLRESRVIGRSVFVGEVTYPYVPGLLYVREGPLMLEALEGLHPKPPLLLVDGHGLLHPRRAGLATVIGVLTDRPTVGIAKGHLFGDIAWVNEKLGEVSVNGNVLGLVFVTAGGRKIYFSVGHLVDADDLRTLLNVLGQKYPEPLLEAHRTANEASKR